MDNQLEEYYKKKISLLTEQCKSYQSLLDIYKSDADAMNKQIELQEQLIKKQDEYIAISKKIDSLEQKKKECVLKFIDEIHNN